jgi:hypothetical protein
MPHQHGAYLGGIRTVEDLRKRCRVDAFSGCWHWGLAIVQGSPSVHFKAPDSGEKRKMRGRKAALYLQRGHDLPAGHLAWAVVGCNSTDCVNPAHCRSGTKPQWGQAMASSGEWRGMPSKLLAARKAAKVRWANQTLTSEVRREIRESTESTRAIASRLGVSQFSVWASRVGKYGQETVAGSSVFTWRPQ